MESKLTENLQDKVDSLHREKGEIREAVFNLAVSNFQENDGCNQCRGRGWIVTWDTMDSMSGCYHESAACDREECTSESRAKSGLFPRNNKYDNFHRDSAWSPVYTEEQSARIAEIDREIRDLTSEIKEEEYRLTPAVNKLIRVVSAGRGPKSRRVPVGTEGLVKKIFCNDYGTRKALIVDADGTKWWPNVKYISVIDDSPDLEPWNELEKKELEQTGTPIIATIMRKSAKAALIKVTTGEEMWVPIGQVPTLKEKKKGETCAIILPTWLAKNKNLTK